MKAKSRIVRWVLGVMACAMCVGCVTAYDPSERDQIGPESQAQQVGTDRPLARATKRPAARAQPASAPASEQAQGQPVTPPGPAEAPAKANEPAPTGSAARELAWFVTVLNGADISSPKGRAALESHFDPRFLQKVPSAKMEEITRSWRRDQFADGAVAVVRTEAGANDHALVSFVKGEATGRYTQIRIETSDSGLIRTLLLSPTVELAARGVGSWEALDKEFAALSDPSGKGKTTTLAFGAYRLKGGDASTRAQIVPIHEFGAGNVVAIGSAFKLYVLAAIGQEVAEGTLKWESPLAISDSLKSLPSGTMQLESEGTEFTIEQFAAKMISISDNTAADHLLDKAGRDRVEKVVRSLSEHADRNTPFISTLEMFKMKLGTDRALAEKYAKADENGKRAMLAKGGDVQRQTPSLAMAAFWKVPYHADDVEWFASPHDLAMVMAELHRLEWPPVNAAIGRVLRLNPGLYFGPAWTSIAYKGGSEPGVLNMTWLLQRKDGVWFVLTLTMNDTKKDIDQGVFIGLATSAANLLSTTTIVE
jgi:beta-lactamase class A